MEMIRSLNQQAFRAYGTILTEKPKDLKRPAQYGAASYISSPKGIDISSPSPPLRDEKYCRLNS